MNRFFANIGVQPRLSLAEIAQTYNLPKPLLIDSVAIFDGQIDLDAMQATLGGITKCGEIIDEIPVKDLNGEYIAELMEQRPRASRIIYGLTVYGGNAGQQKAHRHLALEVKKALKGRGRSSRWMSGKGNEAISPAAIEKLELTTEGYDFVIVIHQDKATIGLTKAVQNADSWSERDFGKPFRDALNGMLPPKLARMMVNIAKPKKTLLDPFCGSGTVLMEAAVIHPELTLFGSDLEQRQIHGAKRNIDWMQERTMIRPEHKDRIQLFTSPVQNVSSHIHEKVDAIVTEGYLGKPLKGHETTEWLERNKNDVESIWMKAIPELAKLQSIGDRLVCTWPIMHSKHQPQVVELDESFLAEHGYTRIHPLEPWDHDQKPIIYKRNDQFVHRQLIVLKKSM